MTAFQIPGLRGKSVLVTGASTGIGAALARAFGAQGAKVAVHYNQSEGPATEVVDAICEAGGEAIRVRADVRDSDAIRAAVKTAAGAFGGIDILVNNAGSLVKRVPVADLTDE